MDPSAATRLATLRRGVARCRRCPLWRRATHAVPGEGDPNAAVMFVGEGPGRREDLTGRPFVGRAGRLLDDLLAHAGLRREDVYITNVVKHRAAAPIPSGRDRPPAADEIEACLPWLMRQIDVIRPRVIVTLGRHAMAAFLPETVIGECHGRVRRCEAGIILPLYHPSYALHSPGIRPVLFRDIETLRTLVRKASAAAKTAKTPRTGHPVRR